MLFEVARRLDRFFRAQDTVARFGGDEFTVLVEGLDSGPEAWALTDLCLATEEVVRVEELVRWEHPTRGLIGPGDSSGSPRTPG